ncbi:cytochrome P450 [Suillus americanus]|nr:cytochrome P450 [Suillus americanus]
MIRLLDLPISDKAQLVLGAVACLGLVGAISFASSESGLPLPPSPPTRSLLGHFLPLRNSFLTIAAWIDEYGPLVTIRSGTEKIVIIGRHKAVVEIVEKQGGSLADRHRMIAAGEILSGGQAIGFMHACDKFRRMRRALHTHLQPKSAETYQPLQMSHAKRMVLDVLDDPYNFQNHVTTFAAATIMKITYGKTTVTSATDPEVREIHYLFESFRTALRPGAYLVESIPWLKYLPCELYTNQLNRVQQEMQSNVNVGPSFAKYMLEHDNLYNLTEIKKAFLGGALFGAGSDSTAVAICTVLMAAACFPEEQAKVQVELDTVIGRHRGSSISYCSSTYSMISLPQRLPSPTKNLWRPSSRKP